MRTPGRRCGTCRRRRRCASQRAGTSWQRRIGLGGLAEHEPEGSPLRDVIYLGVLRGDFDPALALWSRRSASRLSCSGRVFLRPACLSALLRWRTGTPCCCPTSTLPPPKGRRRDPPPRTAGDPARQPRRRRACTNLSPPRPRLRYRLRPLLRPAPGQAAYASASRRVFCAVLCVVFVAGVVLPYSLPGRMRAGWTRRFPALLRCLLPPRRPRPLPEALAPGKRFRDCRETRPARGSSPSAPAASPSGRLRARKAATMTRGRSAS